MFSGIPILHVGLVSFLVVIVNKVCYQKQSIIKHDHFGNTVKILRRNEIVSRKSQNVQISFCLCAERKFCVTDSVI